LQAVASSDEQELANGLQRGLDEALQQAAQEPDVRQAVLEHQATDAAVQKLQSAAQVLNAASKELRSQMGTARGRAWDRLIDSAAESGKPDFAQATQLASVEHRERLTGQAIEHLVEHLTPVAQVARLRAESHALLTRAKAMERMAQQRAERILEQLHTAVSDEVVLPVDMSKGVAGALLAHATGLRRRAIEAAANADQLETWYMQRNRKE
jgi:hypothetical protein